MNDRYIILDEPGEAVTENKHFPVFLKVLIILTFTGCFLRIVTSGVTLYYLDRMNETLGIGDGIYEDNFSRIYRIMVVYCYFNIVTSIVCAFGAFLMLKRRASGYWSYIISQIIFTAILLLVSFAESRLNGSMPAVILDYATIGVVIAFCVMYSVNKKHLA